MRSSSHADELEFELADEAASMGFGADLARAAPKAALVFLHGDLGAGKTTLARGFLRQLGVSGAVRSPTYTLIEPYEFGTVVVYHLDLYRLESVEELELIGIRDYLQSGLVLVEWPERGEKLLSEPDLKIFLRPSGGARSATLSSCSARGDRWVARLKASSES
tara:strand:+ start:674 stop:1162 length:489 start_codon:yes stop_codon:yes gene_type:complete